MRLSQYKKNCKKQKSRDLNIKICNKSICQKDTPLRDYLIVKACTWWKEGGLTIEQAFTVTH